MAKLFNSNVRWNLLWVEIGNKGDNVMMISFMVRMEEEVMYPSVVV